MPGSLRARRDRLHGVGYASPSNIAVWVRPRMGLHEGWIISCGMARRSGRDIPPPIRAFLFATRKDSHNLQYVQPMQRLFLAHLNMHLSFKILRACVSDGAMASPCADQLSLRTFCQLGPLVPACPATTVVKTGRLIMQTHQSPPWVPRTDRRCISV